MHITIHESNRLLIGSLIYLLQNLETFCSKIVQEGNKVPKNSLSVVNLNSKTLKRTCNKAGRVLYKRSEQNIKTLEMTELLTAMFITCELVEWQKKLYPLLKCYDLHPPQPIIQIAIWGTNMHNI